MRGSERNYFFSKSKKMVRMIHRVKNLLFPVFPARMPLSISHLKLNKIPLPKPEGGLLLSWYIESFGRIRQEGWISKDDE